MDNVHVYKLSFSGFIGSHEVHGNYDAIFTLCSESCQEAITSSWCVDPLKLQKLVNKITLNSYTQYFSMSDHEYNL